MDDKIYFADAARLLTQPVSRLYYMSHEDYFLRKMQVSARGQESLMAAVNEVLIATLKEKDATPVNAFDFIDKSRKVLKGEKFTAYRNQAVALLDKVAETVADIPRGLYNQTLVNEAVKFQKSRRRELKSVA